MQEYPWKCLKYFTDQIFMMPCSPLWEKWKKKSLLQPNMKPIILKINVQYYNYWL